MHELGVPDARCEEDRILVHSENGHPVRIVRGEGMDVMHGANDIGKGTAARDHDERVLSCEELESRQNLRKRILK